MVTTFPTRIVQGETFRAEFGVTASSLTVHLRGPASHDIVAEASGDGWVATADSGGATPWAPGAYTWEAWAVVDGMRTLITRQRLDVDVSVLNAGPGYSALNTYEQIVAAIEGFLSSNGSDPTWRRYKINNREMERYGVDELLKMLAHYKRLAAIERRKQRGQSVLGPNINFRF